MEPKVSFFLGANTPSGFYSLYDQLIDPDEARRVYLLKGGPGCGKSSLMRRVAAALEEAGEAAEYIQCSGDPGSLDAVVFPRLGAAIVDATAPHAWRTQTHKNETARDDSPADFNDIKKGQGIAAQLVFRISYDMHHSNPNAPTHRNLNLTRLSIPKNINR